MASPGRRIVPASDGSAHRLIARVPPPTPHNPLRSRRTPRWIHGGRVRVRSIPVRAPFPNVPRHVVQPEPVRGKHPRLSEILHPSRAVLERVTAVRPPRRRIVAPRVFRPIEAAPRRIFPLRFGGKPRPRPPCERRGIVPGNEHHRPIGIFELLRPLGRLRASDRLEEHLILLDCDLVARELVRRYGHLVGGSAYLRKITHRVAHSEGSPGDADPHDLRRKPLRSFLRRGNRRGGRGFGPFLRRSPERSPLGLTAGRLLRFQRLGRWNGGLYGSAPR